MYEENSYSSRATKQTTSAVWHRSNKNSWIFTHVEMRYGATDHFGQCSEIRAMSSL